MPKAAAQLREVEPSSKLAIELGRNIRALRKGRSMTLEQLAARAGLSVSFHSLIERGKKKPSLSALQSISDAVAQQPAHRGHNADRPDEPQVVDGT